MLTWFGREKPKTAGGLPGPATVADVCAGADSARDGTRPCRRLWLPFIPPLTGVDGNSGDTLLSEGDHSLFDGLGGL